MRQEVDDALFGDLTELVEIIDLLAAKLGKKHPDYRVRSLRSDARALVDTWLSA